MVVWKGCLGPFGLFEISFRSLNEEETYSYGLNGLLFTL